MIQKRSYEIRLKRKGKFLCSAVSSPQDRSKRFTPYFPLHSFIQLSEMEQCRLPKVLTPQQRIRTRVLVVESSTITIITNATITHTSFISNGANMNQYVICQEGGYGLIKSA